MRRNATSAVTLLVMFGFAGFFSLAEKKIHAEESFEELFRKAKLDAKEGRFARALENLNKIVSQKPDDPEAVYVRACVRYRASMFEDSLTDFDHLIDVAPRRASSLWERGIACYHAGKFDEGARQFESYQTFHGKDVENAVWHFLCVARENGVEKARENLIPIAGDTRPPMKEVHQLFAGTTDIDGVFNAAKATSPVNQPTALFYANLYVGLFFEAEGKHEQAQPYFENAAGKYRIDHYMGDVARICQEEGRRMLRSPDSAAKVKE